MKRLARIIIFISFLNCSYIHAENEPGLAEYQIANDAGEKLATLLRSIEEPGKKELDAEQKENIRSALVKHSSDYIENLRKSSDLGFPPAQFRYAQTLKGQTLPNNENRTKIKIKICGLLEQSGEGGFLAAAVASASYCPGAKNEMDLFAIMKATDEAYKQLATTLNNADKYTSFYPAKAFNSPTCFDPDLKSVYENLEKLTPLERIQALSPPSLTFEEFEAETYFMLATHLPSDEKARAADYLLKAEERACSSPYFESFKTAFKKRASRTSAIKG